MNEARTGIMI